MSEQELQVMPQRISTSTRRVIFIPFLILCLSFDFCITTVVDIQAMWFFVVWEIIATISIASSLSILDSVSSCHRKTLALKTGVTVLVSAVIGSLAIEALTLLGTYSQRILDPSCWQITRIVAVAALISLFYPILLLFKLRKLSLPSAKSFAPWIIGAAIPLIAGIILAIVLNVVPWAENASKTRALFLLLMVAIAVLLLLYLQRKVSLKPHLTFLVIAMTACSFYSIAAPQVTGVSWDDEIHYDNALGVSYLGAGERTASAELLVERSWLAPTGLPYDELNEVIASIDEADKESRESGALDVVGRTKSPIRESSLLALTSFGYIPSALGLWIARLLHLSSAWAFIAGKLAGATFYSVIMSWAIHVIPTKKVLLSCIGLLPTGLFLASNYAYDPWVTAMISLGIAFIFKTASDKNRFFSFSDMVACSLPILLGLCPKAIYFPVIGLMFLIPKHKFKSPRDYRFYVSFVILFGLVMVATFVTPMLFSSAAQAGDSRGGADVSAIGQIAYILSNPVQFFRTLYRFLLEYLSPVTANDYSVLFAYLGRLTQHLSFISAIPFVVLVVIALVDRSTEAMAMGPRIWMLFVFVAGVALVATALYISYTPVGLGTVNGCQPRYLLPLLFIPAYTLTNTSFESNRLGASRNRRSTHSAASHGALVVLNLLCAWYLMIP